ncbi:MAG: hypothetical protein A2046_01375 [Bacteroidetes bacterium GWA2_30_7]|nr:MAG: hypothetical protein A2046_01375 [Bacteroidetes bacterium GWA2_30_7]
MSAFSKYFILTVLIGTFVYSCKPDEPIEPTPEDSRDKITGTWKCEETSQVFGSTTFTVNISKSSDSSKVLIDNFYNLSAGKKVYAILNNLTLSIPSQTVANDGHIITGNGTLTSNYKTINFSYSANDGSGDLDNVTAIYTKQ